MNNQKSVVLYDSRKERKERKEGRKEGSKEGFFNYDTRPKTRLVAATFFFSFGYISGQGSRPSLARVFQVPI